VTSGVDSFPLGWAFGAGMSLALTARMTKPVFAAGVLLVAGAAMADQGTVLARPGVARGVIQRSSDLAIFYYTEQTQSLVCDLVNFIVAPDGLAANIVVVSPGGGQYCPPNSNAQQISEATGGTITVVPSTTQAGVSSPLLSVAIPEGALPGAADAPVTVAQTADTDPIADYGVGAQGATVVVAYDIIVGSNTTGDTALDGNATISFQFTYTTTIVPTIFEKISGTWQELTTDTWSCSTDGGTTFGAAGV
jgi:hypothetical protein